MVKSAFRAARGVLLPTLLALCAGGLDCSPDVQNPNEVDPRHGLISPRDSTAVLAEWYLSQRANLSPRIEFLADIPSSLLVHGVVLEALPGQSFRLDHTSWVRIKEANRAAYVRLDSIHLEPSMSDTLYTYMGLADDSLVMEMQESKTWLENLTGTPCPTFAYPYHEHDLRTMQCVIDGGYLAARDGEPVRSPWGAALLGPGGDPDWLRTWEETPLWELPLQLLCQTIQALNPDDIAAWLQAPGRLDTWKQNRSWIHLYTHTDDGLHTSTPILDSVHLAALLDALIADGDVWIAPVGEVAAHVRTHHAPGIQEPLIWEPTDPTGIPEFPDERTGPYEGHACAFSFSTDDGWLANLYSYAPVFVSRGLSYTAYLNPAKIQGADQGHDTIYYLNSAEILALSSLGIEIGSHGTAHRHCLSPEVGRLRLVRDDVIAVELSIFAQSGAKKLRLQAIFP